MEKEPHRRKMANSSDFMEPEVNQKYFHNILRRSITQFKLKKPVITNYMIYHLDYLISNFCYFKDIAVVSEYLCTDNNRFNFAFYRRMKVFMQIIEFRGDDDFCAKKACKDVQSLVEALAISIPEEEHGNSMKSSGEEGDVRLNRYPMTKEEWIRTSKEVLFSSTLEPSTPMDNVLFGNHHEKKGDDRMKEMFKKFEISEYFDDGEDSNILVFNSTSKVLKHFFEVLSFHFKVHPHYMIEALDNHFVSTFLSLLNLESALGLFDVLLDLKGLNMQKLAMLLKEAHPVSDLVERRFYIALKMLLLAEWVGEDSDSVSSDEEDFFHDEIMSAGDKLISAFLREESYFEYKQIYDVIEILNYSHRRPRLKLVEFGEIDSRITLYIKLIVGQLDLLMDEIFEKNIHLLFVDLFFKHSDFSVLLFPLTVFLSTAIRESSTFSTLVDIGFIDRFHNACIGCISVDRGPRPATKSFFSCLVYLYPLIAFYLSRSNKELISSDKWTYLSSIMEPYDRMEGLNYCNDEVIEGFLDDCIDESFVRYMCQLIVDEMPVPSTFFKNDKKF